jgi:hypothetical protein
VELGVGVVGGLLVRLKDTCRYELYIIGIAFPADKRGLLKHTVCHAGIDNLARVSTCF